MLRLSEMFESHMVIQRGRPVPVWGDSDANGRIVHVSIADVETVALVEHGHFRATLPSLTAGGPYTLRLQCGKESVICEDVLVGEVWLAGGQSNMEMPLFAAEGARDYLKQTNFSNLRIKTISRRSAGKNGREFGFHFIPESSDEIPWQITTKENIACFSAIGCVMGAKLCQELQVPIGVISCNFGATRIQPWISPETIKIPVFAGDEERFKKRRQALGMLAQEAWKIYQRELEVLLADRDNFVEKSLDDPLYYWQMDAGLHWPPEYAQGDQNEPCCLYRLMLARVIPFAMRGVVWYQGESSATFEDCNRYSAEMEALIDDWRKAFENDDLVFLQTQLAAYDTSRRADPCDWPAIRQAQLNVCNNVRNTYLTNLNGIGEARNIHPRYKIEAGIRLANTALRYVYHHKTPVAPQATYIRREGEWLRVGFENGMGLHVEDQVKQLEMGEGKNFVPVKEWKIEGESLLIRTGSHAIRYGWHSMPEDNLKNAYNLGATPFYIEEE